MNDRKKASKQSFDFQAQTYDVDKNGKHARKQYIHIIQQIRRLTFSNALDVGCGTGEILSHLLEEYPDMTFSGIDISEKMLEQAQWKTKNRVHLSVGDAENLPYENDSFDLVICNDSFHHYPNPQQAMNEFHRVLKRNGHLLLSDYWKPLFSRTIINFFMPYNNDGDVKIYSEKEMLEFINVAGFKKSNYEKFKSAIIFIAHK